MAITTPAAEEFTPVDPGDRKYGGQRIPGVRIIVDDRDRLHSGRLGASILWALTRTSRDSLRLTPAGFDLRLGNAVAREALLAGEDPDTVIDREIPAVVAFERAARPFFLYR